jgi:1-acyl-sn-glycerol-3-phosphate acyltransferase
MPLVFAFWAFVTAAAPALFALALVVDLARAPARKGAATARMVLLTVSVAWIEALGLLALFGAGLVSIGDSARRQRLAYALQRRYVAANLSAVRASFALRFEVTGLAEGERVAGPVTVFVRHSSVIDVLIPGVFVANAFGLRLRYVLKDELLWEPCLDLAGHWVPNHFVDRSGKDTARELEAVERLARDLGQGEGVLIYPEGTRFTRAKRARALERLAGDPAARADAEALRHLLPIRPGGALALLREGPPRDVLFVGHAGLEGFSSLADLWRGALAHRTVKVRFWREPAPSVPGDEERRLAWLREAWHRMDAWLAAVDREDAHAP